MGNFIDITDKDFGRLHVVTRVGTKHGESLWLCRCECRKSTKVTSFHIRSGHTKSCGCMFKEYQNSNESKSRLYTIWDSMKQRCLNPKAINYKHYGGRGIQICTRWLGKSGFKNFKEDMGNPPKGKSLDRRNNDKGYSKKNCRWASKRTQANNTRANRIVEFEGKKITLAQACRKSGVNYNTASTRLFYGKSIEKALAG